ncbi:hypothetical protein [Candidatus Burkholderia verschuerenii]|uniref:hypothetical protein n=1 Tax=Candidatus Burkholderia verschuerenii TaxID=242163 RepID=UPI00067BC267|nr:hypothetical protein [Candidatus Burkholderia verschuerenii]
MLGAQKDGRQKDGQAYRQTQARDIAARAGRNHRIGRDDARRRTGERAGCIEGIVFFLSISSDENACIERVFRFFKRVTL